MKRFNNKYVDADTDKVIEENNRLIEALKNLNNRLCCDDEALHKSSPHLPEDDIKPEILAD